MTHTPLTKAEREELRKIASDFAACEMHIEDVLPGAGMLTTPAATALRALPRLLADIAAAEAERDALRKIAVDCCNATDGMCTMGVSIEFLSHVPKEVALLKANRNMIAAQRDRAESERDKCCDDYQREAARAVAAESELDAERRMRVEAEAASTAISHAFFGSAVIGTTLAERVDYLIGFSKEVEASRCGMVDELASTQKERDALKAKLADPRRVLIHETEVVATKEEIATLKARLADLSEADEELHTCRALVNATSENLSVDLERMVDDLAEANEKAARSEKDSHSWHELYKDTKAKLAALVDTAETYVRRSDGWVDAGERLCVELPKLRAAIAAARGGAS